MIRLQSVLVILLVIIVSNAIWHRYQALPKGMAIQSDAVPADRLALLIDDTWQTPAGTQGIRQEIFDEVFRLINQAEHLVVVDMFLFNDFLGAGTKAYRPLSEQLTQALLAKRQRPSPVPVLLITDPVNTLYGGLHSTYLARLQAAGVIVVTTPLAPLRDSNPSWSGLWRLCCQWAGNNPDAGWLSNPMGPGDITLRSYLALLNFKANHRKTLIVDEGGQWTGLVTSANPHDGSSAHSNLGLRFSGAAARQLLESELAVVDLAGIQRPHLPDLGDHAAPPSQARMEVLTEGAIRDALLDTVNRSTAGDRLSLAVFYLSHRPLVEALLKAHQRGVQVRVLLDPNKDAFGRQKNGIPNRQVGRELHDQGIDVRWCNTQGEQCHTKMLMLTQNDRSELILGSANFTRRNLDNLNLETSVRLFAPATHPVARQAQSLFQRRWSNLNNEMHSVEFLTYADDSAIKSLLYRFMEFTGWSSF